MQCLQNWVLIVVTLVLGISFLHMHVCKNCKSKVLVQYWMTISFKLFSISRKYFNSNSKGWIKAESEFNCRKKVHLIFGIKRIYYLWRNSKKKSNISFFQYNIFPTPINQLRKFWYQKMVGSCNVSLFYVEWHFTFRHIAAKKG